VRNLRPEKASLNEKEVPLERDLKERKDTMTDNSIPHSNKIGIRVSDYKPGVMYQTQAAGIEFAPSYRSLDTYCPKCGAHNTPVYFPGMLRQRHVSARVQYPVSGGDKGMSKPRDALKIKLKPTCICGCCYQPPGWLKEGNEGWACSLLKVQVEADEPCSKEDERCCRLLNDIFPEGLPDYSNIGDKE
jgi:hypothetical protein